MSNIKSLLNSSQLLVSIYVRRDRHDNGMTIEEYAQEVMGGRLPVLEHDQFVYQFGSIEDEIKLVEDWAIANNLTVFESGADIATVKVQGTNEQFNTLFNIILKTVTDDGRTYLTHTGEITLPGEINDVVARVGGLDNTIFARVCHSQPVVAGSGPDLPITASVASYPNKSITNPQSIARAYDAPDGTGIGQRIACLSSAPLTGYLESDVMQNFDTYGVARPTLYEVSVNGYTNPGAFASLEADLDLMALGSMAPSATLITYWCGATSTAFVDCVNTVAADTTYNPSILSISYTFYGGDYTFLESAFTACIVKGILIFVATGDRGGNNTVGHYLGTSPQVIAVGGTALYLSGDPSSTTNNAWQAEVADPISGGGLSTVHSLPTWQGSPSRYYTTMSSGGTLGSPTLLGVRGYPDVCAVCDGYTSFLTYRSPHYYYVGGTSMSAPVVAGLFARLNKLLGRRIQFAEIMMLLYNNSDNICRDVVLSNNAQAYGTNGYNTTTGWDAVTGLGSIKFTAVYNILRNRRGGGGAGGLVTSTIPIDVGASYAIVIGAGGTGSTFNSNATNGSSSSFIRAGGVELIAFGGGAAGQSGGSGGGTPTNLSNDSSAGSSTQAASVSGGRGFAGGSNPSGMTSVAASGGGGAGDAGGNSSSATGGAGGAGRASSITASSVTYAPGGGGFGYTTGGTSASGGGTGGTYTTNGTSGTTNIGAGGGAGGLSLGGAGGSGVVIISYSDAYGNITNIPGTLTYTRTVTGGKIIYKFTAGSGTITI